MASAAFHKVWSSRISQLARVSAFHTSKKIHNATAIPLKFELPPSLEPKLQHTTKPATTQTKAKSSNPPLSFPCIDQLDLRTRSLDGGPEPTYEKIVTGYSLYQHEQPLLCDHGGVLPKFDIAYETWGELNENKDNAILIQTGLSGSSHAKSHEKNVNPGCYRSGPEWEQRFGRKRGREDQSPALCPDFLIETYLDYQGERFCLQYDPNSLLYISKAMDLFDMSYSALEKLNKQREINTEKLQTYGFIPESQADPSCYANANASQQTSAPSSTSSSATSSKRQHISSLSLTSNENIDDLVQGLSKIQIPTLVLGVQSDILFAHWQQKEIAECLSRGGNKDVTYYELDSMYGHDTFLIDLTNVGGAIKGHLELGG
ncbi:Alpha/Beta hydrolase protein [Gigaspora rosea]|uniref:Alpha/Beta hydrolase protein n=1 Tax=Gigaspora rosea TaxID=44941 RepID=A0A397U5L4_9GLOM|nr:Alpha/Beta hydrolase protein [Gigaspora rosea]